MSGAAPVGWRPPDPACPRVVAAAMAGGARDVRKAFLLTTTQNYFGLLPEPCDQPRADGCPEVNNFLDDGNQMLLRVQRSDAGVTFSNSVRALRLRRRPSAPQARPGSWASSACVRGSSPSPPP